MGTKPCIDRALVARDPSAHAVRAAAAAESSSPKASALSHERPSILINKEINVNELLNAMGPMKRRRAFRSVCRCSCGAAWQATRECGSNDRCSRCDKEVERFMSEDPFGAGESCALPTVKPDPARERFKRLHRLARCGGLAALTASVPQDMFAWLVREVFELRYPRVGSERHLAQRTYDELQGVRVLFKGRIYRIR